MLTRSTVKKLWKALNMCSWDDIMNVVARIQLLVYTEVEDRDH